MQTKREQIETLIRAHGEVFQDAFLLTNPSDEDIKRAEQELGFEIPENYLWFLKKYGHGGFFFEFLGYGLTGNSLFVRETLKQRENYPSDDWEEETDVGPFMFSEINGCQFSVIVPWGKVTFCEPLENILVVRQK